ncbi:MAG TPA: hypothetical protein VFR55_01910 [Dehalococcoidia bacterium]|nr:hypothetical protein [Dehalococcoidia bacterium]
MTHDHDVQPGTGYALEKGLEPKMLLDQPSLIAGQFFHANL